MIAGRESPHPWLLGCALLPALLAGAAQAQDKKPKKPTNRPPVPEPAKLVTDEDSAGSVVLRAKDADEDALSWRVVNKPRRGEVSLGEKTGKLSYTPRADFSGSDAATVEVTDGKARARLSVGITVKPVNDAPTASAVSVTGREDAAAKGRVRGQDKDGDKLTFKLAKKSTNGSVTVEEKTGAFTYKPKAQFFGDDAFSVSVSDGKASATAKVSVKVTPVNDPPTANASTASGDEDGTLEGRVTGADVEGDKLTYSVARGPRRGKLTMAADGAFTYTPRADFHGSDTFEFQVSDGKARARAEVKLTIRSVNDAPTTSDVTVDGREDAPAKGRVRGQDKDGDKLTFKLAKKPANGSVTVEETGAFTYTPKAQFHGEDAFSVSVSDGKASAMAKVTVKVASVNDKPTATAGSASGDEDGELTGAVSGADVDGDALSYVVARAPRSGTLALDKKTGAFTYTPRANFHGDDSFAFDASDGKASDRAEVKLTVRSVNDPPVAKGAAANGREDVKVSGRVTASDPDGDKLTFKLAKEAANGAVTIDAKSGAFAYTPRANFHGDDSFAVSASDGKASAKSTVNVTILPVNDKPTANAGSASGDEDTELTGTVSGADVDGDALSYVVARAPRSGKLALDKKSGSFTYTPRANFNGDDSFAFDASDGKASDRAEVKLTVRPVNDPPTAKDTSATTREDAKVTGRVNAVDPDGDAFSYKLASRPSRGKVTFDAKSGSFTYAPSANVNGEDSFVVEASDGKASAKSTVTVKIVAVNDAPAADAGSASGDEDQKITGSVSASDVDGDTLAYVVGRAPRSGKLALDRETGAFTYTPRANFHGDDSFAFDASDGKTSDRAEVKLTVRPVNDAPTTRDLALATREDAPARGRVGGSDPDGDKLTFRVAQSPSLGDVQLDEKTGSFTYTPTPDENGDDRFTVDVSDGNASAAATVTVKVAPVPDPPRVGTSPIETREDEPATVSLPASDPDGDKLTFKLLGQPKLGNAKLEPDGSVTFTPRPDVNGDDELAFEVSDGSSRVRGKARIRVAPVNDAPEADGLELTTREGQAVEGALTGRDKDGDKLRFRVAKKPNKGKVTFKNGKLRYDPGKNSTGTVRFSIVADDGKAKSAPAQVVVKIANVNDAPVAQSQRIKTAEDREYRGVLKGVDVDGDPLVYSLAQRPGRGKVVIEDARSGTFSYTPKSNLFGSDRFLFRVTDPNKASSTASVFVEVTPVDDPPSTVPSYREAPRRGRITGTLEGYDPEGKDVTYKIVQQPRRGSVRLLDARTGEYVFETDGSGSGSVQFGFTVSDGRLESDVGYVEVIIR